MILNKTSIIKAISKWNITDLHKSLVVFISSFIVYILTLYPTVGTEDSGELITAAATLDIAHPSGYPLHTLLGKLFTIIIPFGNIGWRVNLMSAFFAAATVMVLYLVLKKILKNDAIAISTSLFFAFSDIFWSQSIRTEIYTLNSFFLILIIFLLVLWDKEQRNKYLYLTALVFGLSLSNSHQIFLAAPPIFLFIILRNWRAIISPKILAICTLLLIIGLSVNLYLPIRSSLGPYYNPAISNREALNTPAKFINFINRKSFGGTINISRSKPSETDQGIMPPWLISIKDTIGNYAQKWAVNNQNGLIIYMHKLCQQLLYLPIILFLLGVYYLFKNYKKINYLLLGLFAFFSTIQLIIIPFHSEMIPIFAFSARPFLIPATLLLLIFSAAGIKLIYEKIKHRAIKIVVYILLTLLPILTFSLNYYSNNESGNYLAYDFSRNLLESVPKNGYLISKGQDNITFTLYYLRKVENIRPDIELKQDPRGPDINQQYIENKLKKENRKMLFIDLVPNNFRDMNLTPYNFVLMYSQDSTPPPDPAGEFKMRGLRDNMDWMNEEVKCLYYFKMAMKEEDKQKANEWYAKIENEIIEHDALVEFIRDYHDYQNKIAN